METSHGTVLICGASGLFGGAAAQAFAAGGWQVRRFVRGTDMAAAARGADVIVNALNPPRYHNWAKLLPRITEEVIAAAKASGATVILPGNVYVFGAQPAPWGPDTPHRPVSRKGAIRAAIEARYAAAADQGVRSIVLRGGDFLAPDQAGSILNMIVLKDMAKGRITSVGAPDVRRAHAYLPDMARAAVALADRRAELPAFADIPFPGLTFSTADLAAEIARQTGAAIRITRFNWMLMRLLSPFWELAREFLEMRYLYDTPHSLDPALFDRLLPDFQPTALAQVVAEHLAPPHGKATSTQTSR